MTTENVVDRAIQAAGSQTILAKALDVTVAAIYDFRRRGRFPADRVLDVCRATKLSPYEVDPILYPNPAWRTPRVRVDDKAAA